MDENRPGYYAVIPASVRYDDKIPANAKLLYGEISALIGAEGYCFASNQYFAAVYKMSSDSISRLITKLEDNGYIKRVIDKDDSGQVVGRKIYLTVSIPDIQPPDNFADTPLQKNREGIDKKVKDTNLSNTNIEKKNIEKEKSKRTPKPVYSDEELHAVLIDWIKTLPDSAGWNADARNALFLALLGFYAPREKQKQEPQRTKAGVTALCNKLSRESGNNPRIMIDMVETATAAGWKSVYPPKGRVYPPSEESGSPGGDKEWL